ncbi:hypothetical protein PIB30_019644 [Stylosanthes scabra]|uniref:Uncharacterized protein n=1 Tax=Stylosanthes scabra TaxID=79078 RepID=A0ABU6S836_9FABA|nr:hypothetical protein [Stylosanthes scabra]
MKTPIFMESAARFLDLQNLLHLVMDSVQMSQSVASSSSIKWSWIFILLECEKKEGMKGDESFLALVHHDGRIKHKIREGVKFTDKSPTNVFITMRTRLADLQHSIFGKLGLDGRKWVNMIYYRISISMVSQGVKYGCFAVERDGDLQVLFHCRRQFSEVRTTELFVEIVDPLASYGSSAPNPQSINVGGHLVLGFNEKEAVLAVKNYNIHRGVEYMVMESDHAKYLGKCKEFGKVVLGLLGSHFGKRRVSGRCGGTLDRTHIWHGDLE